jgi:cell division protein FtsB
MPAHRRTPFWYRWALVALIAMAGLYIERRELVRVHLEYRESAGKAERLESRLADLEAEAAALERRVEYLQSDPVELEAAVRAEKKLLREGETIYRIVLPDERPDE